jgi:hypothetical protein
VTGLAVKAADGETRAIRPALRELVRLLGGPDVSQLAPVPVLNSHGEEVGEVVADS